MSDDTPADVPREQVRRWQETTGAAFRKRWQTEKSTRSAEKRNKRGKRPGKPITGVRLPPP